MYSSLKYISREKEEVNTSQERKKKRVRKGKVSTKFQGISERVSDVFSLINREILVILLLVERGCNSNINFIMFLIFYLVGFTY